MPRYHTASPFVCLPISDYQEEEYRLIGLAIKFAGICGKEVRIIGTNRQTVDPAETTH
jgi:hypothetical protein